MPKQQITFETNRALTSAELYLVDKAILDAITKLVKMANAENKLDLGVYETVSLD